MITRHGQLGELTVVGTAAEIGIAGTATAEVSSVRRGRRPATNRFARISGIYLTDRWSLDSSGSIARSKECSVMDHERDREQLEKKLDLCRRLSGAASDPATSIRLAKLIEELKHSLRETEYSLGAS